MAVPLVGHFCPQLVPRSAAPRSIRWVLSATTALAAVATALAAAAAPAAAAATFPFFGVGDFWHSFEHPFHSGPNEALLHWEAKGAAILTSSPDVGGDVVRLTPAVQGRSGIMVNTIRTNSNDFSGYIDFEVRTSKSSHEAADGFGFWFLRDSPALGPAMGINEKFVGLGVVVDTFANTRSTRVPYVYGLVNDGTRAWDFSSDGAKQQLTPGCRAELDRPMRMYVSYEAAAGTLKVAMSQATAHAHWYHCFEATNVHLPFSGGLFAVSAETGHFFATHDVAAVQIVADHRVDAADAPGAAVNPHDVHSTLLRDEHDTHVPAAGAGSSGGAAAATSGVPPEHHAQMDAAFDAKIGSLRASLAAMGVGAPTGAATSDVATLSKMELIKSVVTEMLDAVTVQQNKFSGLLDAVNRLNAASASVHLTSESFSRELRQVEHAIESLQYATEELDGVQRSTGQSLAESHRQVADATARHTSASALALRYTLFAVAQLMVAGLAWVLHTSSFGQKKGGMV